MTTLTMLPSSNRYPLPSPQVISDAVWEEGKQVTKELCEKYDHIIKTEFPPPITATSDCWTDTTTSSEIFGLTVHHLEPGSTETTTNWIGCGKFDRYYREAMEQKHEHLNNASVSEQSQNIQNEDEEKKGIDSSVL